MSVSTPASSRPAWLRPKDPASWLTHFLGFLAATFGAWLLLAEVADRPFAQSAAMATYAASLVLVFAASSCYHFFDIGETGNRTLRKVDHAAIYLMIGGTSIPAMVHYLDGTWRVAMLWAIGLLAGLGILTKVFWMHQPRWLSVGGYVLFGWVALIPGHRMLPEMSPEALQWLVIGGISYTVGAMIYGFKRPNPWPEHFGFHEIWHLFVLGGAAAHYQFVADMVDHPFPAF